MRHSSERALTPVHGPPVREGAPPPGVVLSRRAVRVAFANIVCGLVALVWLLPSPWGGVVPVLLLAQVVWIRHGVVAAAVGTLLGGTLGAGLGVLLGMEDARRAALALLLLLLPAMAAWPRRG